MATTRRINSLGQPLHRISSNSQDERGRRGTMEHYRRAPFSQLQKAAGDAVRRIMEADWQ